MDAVLNGEAATEDLVVVVVFVPSADAEVVRLAAAAAGAGAIGNYRACSFAAAGVGRFEPQQGAQPAIGAVGQLERVEEDRIEVVCPVGQAARVVEKVLAAHPYEEPAWHAYRAISRADLEAWASS